MFLKGVTSTTKKSQTFLSRLLQPTHQRRFALNAVQAYVNAVNTTQEAERIESGANFNESHYQKLQSLSQAHLRKQQEKEAAEAEWLAQLRSPQQKEGIFAQISSINEGDHEHLKEVKNRIASLVKQELDALRFEEQLKREQQERLASDVYKEVKTKSNFYFKVDENKVSKNLKVYNTKAPGNHHRHPSVILPHEHVHIQHWFDTDSLTQDKLTEIYAYYSHMIDLHIS